MKKENKFTEQFETWATAISEGTWALPETDEDKDKLIDILGQELPVGVDAQNATNVLYNIFGDDSLFDALEELAAVDPEADARDTVMDHLMDKNPTMYQAILDAIGDEDTPEPAETGSEGGDLDEAYDPAPVVINSKQVDLGSIELDGVESWDRPDYADAYAVAAEFTDGTPLSEQELEELSEKHGDVINMVAHDMLESVASDAAEATAKPGKFSKTYGSGDGGMDGQVEEAKDKVSYDPKTGKLTGWEHEGDWEKAKGKDPVGKIHHMSDVARKRTEKMAKDTVKEDDEDLLANTEAIQSAIIRRILNDINQHSELLKKAGPDGVMNAASDVASFHAPMEEIGSSDVSIMVREVYREVGVEYPEDEHSDLHEAFNKALGEAAINVGDTIRDKTQPTIQGKVVGDMDENYIIQVEDDQYHIKKLNAERVATESIAGDDHVNKDIKMKRMGAKELSISDKFKIMPSQMQAMKKGDSENDLLHYNKLQAKNPMAEMKRLAGLK